MWGCSFLPGVEGHIKVRYYRIWKLFYIRYNVVEITFSKKVKYMIRFNIWFFKVFFIYLFVFSFFFLLLTNKEPPKSTLQILALITLAFVSSDATLNIFGYSYPNMCSIAIRTTRGNWYFFFFFCRKKTFSYANSFENTMKLPWVTQNDV